MKRNLLLTGAFTALGILAQTGVALASSHREAPAISRDPAADNTDLWAWESSDMSKVWIVAAYNPMEEPSGGPNFHKFSDDVLYEVHVTRGDSSLADVVTYQIRFATGPLGASAIPGSQADQDAGLANVGGGKEFFAQISGGAGNPLGYFGQVYTVTKIVNGTPTVVAANVPVAPPNIGPRTNAAAYQLGKATYAQFSTSSKFLVSNNGYRVWAGPRDDGFYVDLARIFDLADFAGTATPPLQIATDGLAGFNCHAIALEIPTTELTANGQAPVAGTPGNAKANDPQTLGIWASASRRKVRVLRADGTETGIGPWVQVSRQGLPLINEAVIGIQDKDKYNRTTPAMDVQNFGAYFLNPVVVKDAYYAGVYGQLGVPDNTVAGLAYNRLDIVGVINMNDIPATGSHNIQVPFGTGDVIRLDMGFPTVPFPNGRAIGAGTTKEVDVTDVELSLILTGKTSGVGDGVNDNDATYLADMPFLATPWEGATQGHGKTPNPNN
jgi:hypothetical protein